MFKEQSWVSEDKKYGGTIVHTDHGSVLTLCQDSQLTLIKENLSRVNVTRV